MKRYTEINVHLYIDNIEYPELAEEVKILKAKRKLNKYLIEALIRIIKERRESELF